MANWKRCRAAMTVAARGTDRVEHLWPGLVVNLERELAPGFTLGDAVGGRESDFEDATDPTLAPQVQAVTHSTKKQAARLED